MVSVVAGNVFYGSRHCFFYGFRRGKERFVIVSVVVLFMVSGCYRTTAVSPMEAVKKTPERFQDELSIYVYTHTVLL